MKIEFLNHASVVLDFGTIRLVCDPWYFGHCFDGGWGLRYNNANALSAAADSTHLWISHFHPDHFHAPTLAALAERNPEIICLSNRSSNFDMEPALRKLGFRHIVRFAERMPFELSREVRVTRYPATGIDNMLLVDAPGVRLLNYNDCQLPLKVVKGILGDRALDILLLNFNIAEKLLDYPAKPPQAIREWLSQRFLRVVETLGPKYVVPFASHHYFRASETQGQNLYLMEAKDLTALSPKVFAMPVGGLVHWTQNTLVAEPVPSADVTRTQPSIEEHKETPPLDSAVSSARAFCSRLRRHYFGLTFWIGKLKVHLPEYNGVLHLSAWKVRFIPGEDKADIRVSAGALCNWLSKRYGTDGLYVGGHFSVVSADTSRIRRFLLACMLVENRLDPLSMLAQLCAGGGFKFLVNRREEILSVVARRKFSPGIGARE